MTDGFYNSTMRLLGKKWTMHVLEEIGSQNKTRFCQIKDKFGKITSSTLSSILKELEENELIEKTIINKTPLRIEYALTRKGRILLNMLMPVLNWSNNGRLPYTDVSKLLVISAIESTLLEMGDTNLATVQNLLIEQHSATLYDCVENPHYLKSVLGSLFGNAHTEIIKQIREKINDSMRIETKFSSEFAI